MEIHTGPTPHWIEAGGRVDNRAIGHTLDYRLPQCYK